MPRWLRDTPVEERIKNYRIVDDCWIWNGSLDKSGYGYIKHHKKTTKVHRTAYELWIGPLKEGYCICHKCDNPACINPDHLWQGTVRDNNYDTIRKNRFRANPNPRDSYGRFT